MKVFSKMKFRALPKNKGWPMEPASNHVGSEAMALLLRDPAIAARSIAGNPEQAPRPWSDNCNGLSRAALNGGNVKVISKEKFQVLAERNGWSLERAKGYVDGETFRLRAKKPSKCALIGIDEYSLGFRAGYYERRKEASQHSLPDLTRTR
jgi:hypothetical protein